MTKKCHYDEEECREYKEWPIPKSTVAIIILAVLGVTALVNWVLALIMAFVVGWIALRLARSTGSSRLNYSGNARQRAQGKKEDDDFVVHKRICEVSKRYCQGEKARQIAKDLGVSIASVKRGIKKAKKENIIRESL